MKRAISLLLIVLLLTPLGAATAQTSTSTAFTYQGQLRQSGTLYTGTCNFELSLWDALTSGSQIGSTQTITSAAVDEGLFTVQVDFGSPAFAGEARWLETAVQCGGDPGYTTLAPRQELTATPYSIYALGAPWSGLTGVPAGFADGVDDGATYTAGNGLQLIGNEFSVVWSTIPGRPSGACSSPERMTGIGSDGSIGCDTVTTGVVAGTGLSGGAAYGEATLSADTTYLQRRVESCGSLTAAIRVVNEDGSVQCVTAIGGGGVAGRLAEWTDTYSMDEASVGVSDLQLRVSGTCTAGSSIRVVNSDGTVTCEADDIGVTGSGTTNELAIWASSSTVSGSGVFVSSASIITSTAIGARVYRTTDLTLTTGVVAMITFDAERFDSANLHSTVSNTSRITAPQPGVYMLTCTMRFNSNATGARSTTLYANGTEIAANSTFAGSGTLNLETSTLYYFNAGDYGECSAFQNSGGNLAISVINQRSIEFAMVRVP